MTFSAGTGAARQRAGENPPGQPWLCDEAERDVCALADEVVGPAAEAPVLQPLVEGEDVEQDEQRDEDAVDEPGGLGRVRRTWGEEVDHDGRPGHDSGDTPEREWQPTTASR